jgi:hypothetical protein
MSLKDGRKIGQEEISIALQVLIDLATAYLEIKDWPEEKALWVDDNTDEVQAKDIAFNVCLHACKLALLKKCEGLDKVIGGMTIDASVKEVTTAIRTYLLEGK